MTSLALDLRRVAARYPTGVAVLAGLVTDEPTGMAANSFTSVSLDPPIVSVCVAHTSTTWPRLRIAPRIGINVLGATQQGLSVQFSSRSGDRFAGVSWRATPAGCVRLPGAAAWFECSIEREVCAGDHDIVLFRVHDIDATADVAPLVFHDSRYRRLA
jgi:flavin reductase (DIM6/NTAB) family NADH-FMN oxidoreductase RutF